MRATETAADLTGLGMLGTPAFAARADIRADIYGLGCTLYYLLTGNPPFSGNPHFAVLKAHGWCDNDTGLRVCFRLD